MNGTPLRAAVASCLLLLAGCKARDLGIPTSDSHASLVDHSWVAAAESCWPELASDHYSPGAIQHNLADPLRFRSTFGSYAAQSDHALAMMVAKPVEAAPVPDPSVMQGSRTPILTRGQASAGVDPHTAALQAGNGAPPPDALCAVHAGIPAGFK